MSHLDRAARLVTVAALVAVLALALRPDALLPRGPFTEDAFYSLSVARHLALGLGPTIDGSMLTNGFQPLFTLLCVGAYLPFGGDRMLGLRAVMLLQGLVLAATAWVVGDVARRLAPPERGDLAGTWTTFLWATSCYVFSEHLNGLETGFQLLGYAVVVRAVLGGAHETRRGAVGLGVLLGLLVLTRIDAAIFVALLAAAVLLGPGVDRLARALALGATAVLVSSPWFAYNAVVFGSVVPTSGTAQQRWAWEPLRVSWAQDAIGMLTAPFASMAAAPFEDLPWKLGRAVLGLVLLGVAVRTTPAGGLVAPDVRPRLRTLVTAGGATALAIWAYYVLGSFATWHYHRYLAPGALAVVVFHGLQLAARSPRTRAVALVVVPLLLGRVLVDAYTTSAFRDSIYWKWQIPLVDRHVPPGTLVGAWQSGTFGYFREPVLNLDGKVNAEALRRTAELRAYLRERHVDWIVDFPLHMKPGLGTTPEEDGWEVVAAAGRFALYHRRDAGPVSEAAPGSVPR
jgi:hypothetical protein